MTAPPSADQGTEPTPEPKADSAQEPPPEDAGWDQEASQWQRDRRQSGLVLLFNGPTSFGGHAAGEDVTIGASGGSPRPAVGPIDEEDLALLRRVFQPPDCWSAAREVLERRRVLVLRGRADGGKYSAAVRLLDELSSSGVSALAPDIELAHVSPRDIAKSHGYIVRSLWSDRLPELSAVRLSHLSRLLEEQQAFLVITIDDPVRLPEDELTSFVVRHEMPDPQSVLRRHVAARVADAGGSVDRALIDDGEVQRELTARPAPRAVRSLAGLLAAVQLGGLSKQEALAQAQGSVEEEAQHCLRRLGTNRDSAELPVECLRRRAFFIAVAAFGHLPYATVAEAAYRLEPHLHGIETPRRPLNRDLFTRPRLDWLELTDALSRPMTVTTQLGQAATELISLRNPALPRAVLTTLWRDFALVRAPILDWLKALTDGEAVEATRVAQVVGLLASLDFDYTHRRVIDAWARSRSARLRQNAAWALEAAAYDDPHVAEQVRRLLHRWCESGSAALRRSAITAYGTSLGAKFPDDAIKGIALIAADAAGTGTDDDTRRLVTGGLTELALSGQHARALGLLELWTGGQSGDRTLAAKTVRALCNVIAPDGRPLLLTIADAQLDQRPRLLALLINGCGDGETRGAVWRSIHRWVLSADADPDIRRPVDWLIPALHADAATTRQVRFYLNLWTRGRRPSQHAAALLERLEEKRNG